MRYQVGLWTAAQLLSMLHPHHLTTTILWSKVCMCMCMYGTCTSIVLMRSKHPSCCCYMVSVLPNPVLLSSTAPDALVAVRPSRGCQTSCQLCSMLSRLFLMLSTVHTLSVPGTATDSWLSSIVHVSPCLRAGGGHARLLVGPPVGCFGAVPGSGRGGGPCSLCCKNCRISSAGQSAATSVAASTTSSCSSGSGEFLAARMPKGNCEPVEAGQQLYASLFCAPTCGQPLTQRTQEQQQHNPMLTILHPL